ncbi:hypothetical protein [Leuconostoc mesenteroides]|uniref:hypothetical protein n=1 Tax=Leuconostoc mesenteroides TaxID=1245 RepID=UPI0011A9D9AB|nr:hypothetical protein [Leuconostoc mesenteroides]
MKMYTCSYCGQEFTKSQMDSETLAIGYEDEYLCKSCSDELLEAGRDAVDPDHNFSSFEDWDENGH